MRGYIFTVIFGENPMASYVRFETVTAHNEVAATILAQVNQIKKGNRFDDVYRADMHESLAAAEKWFSSVGNELPFAENRDADIAHHGLTGE